MWRLTETLRDIEEKDESLVLELIDSFQSDTASRFQRLHDAVAKLDAARLKAEAHSIHGSASQMGAEALAAQCRALEAGALARNWPELESQVKQAEVAFAEVGVAMSEYVKARRAAATPNSPLETL
jgi:HPt (histidine-containing phosphotransfer) domain-containing protein